MTRGSFGASSGIVSNDAGRFEAEASEDGGFKQKDPGSMGKDSEGFRRVTESSGALWRLSLGSSLVPYNVLSAQGLS
jgi:hypothetical protein